MDMSNGTTIMIANMPNKIIGKTGDGRIIVQMPSGLQVNFLPSDLEKIVDKQ